MTLAFPWILYGYIYQSDGSTGISGATVEAIGDTATTDTTDNDGKYLINLQDYASSGITVSVKCKNDNLQKNGSFKLVVSDPGKQLNFSLGGGEIYMDTLSYGNELYLDNDSWEL